MLASVYHIYWISVHLSQNLSLGVIKNCEWDVSKPENAFDSPTGLWKVISEVPVFLITPFKINTSIDFKEVPQVLQV